MQPGVLPEEGLQPLLIPLPCRFGTLFVQLTMHPVPVPFGGIRGRVKPVYPVPGPPEPRSHTLHLAARHSVAYVEAGTH